MIEGNYLILIRHDNEIQTVRVNRKESAEKIVEWLNKIKADSASWFLDRVEI
jgi:hypothetical protein